MPTAKKIATVAELREQVARASVTITTDYSGMSVGQMQGLRRALRETGADLRVVKLTLLRRAAEEAGRGEMLQVVEGPTALAIGYADIVAPAKALTEYIRTARLPMTIRGGWAEGQVLSAGDVTELATVPPREELLSRIAGGLQSPLVNLVGLLNAATREFAGLIDARATQLEGTES